MELLSTSFLISNEPSFLSSTAQFDTSNNLFYLALLTLEFLFTVFFTSDTIHFHCLYMKPNQTTLLIIEQHFLTNISYVNIEY